MKIRFTILAVATTLACACSQNSINPDPNPSPEVLTPTEFQKKIETTSNAFLDEIKTNDFSSLADLAEYFVETYANENVDYSEIEEKYSKVIEDAFVTNKNEGYDKASKTYYIDSFEKFILNIYDYKGAITAGQKKWTCKASDNFSLEFKDQFGKTCIISLVPEGSIGKVLMHYSSRYRHYHDFDINGDGVVDYENFEDRSESQFYAYVPETLKLTLTQASNAILKAEYRLSSNLADFDLLNTDAFQMLEGLKMEFSASFTCYDYTLNVERLYYNGKEAQESVNLVHKGKTLLSESLSVHDFTFDQKSEYLFKGGKCESTVNIMDEIQLGMSVSDIYNYISSMDDVQDFEKKNLYNDLSAAVDKVNSYMEIKMYVNGSEQVQATVELRPFKGSSNCYAEPVIVFEDGSSFSFEDYFGGKYFEDLSKRIEELINEFMHMVY